MCVCVRLGSAPPAFQSPSAADFPLNVIEMPSAMNNTFTFHFGAMVLHDHFPLAGICLNWKTPAFLEEDGVGRRGFFFVVVFLRI